MPSRHRSLKSLVFTALKRAGAENRLDVAEHLIRALEVLDADDTQSSHQRLLLRVIEGGADLHPISSASSALQSSSRAGEASNG